MKKLLFIIIVSMYISSCAPMSTMITHRVNKNDSIIKNIGIIMPVLDSNSFLICPKILESIDSAIITGFEKYDEFNYRILDKSASIYSKENITLECNKNNLDALLFFSHSFVNTKYTLAFIPIAQNYDSKVAMELFNNKGELVLATTHNTLQMNAYFTLPSSEETTRDATYGALKVLLKHTVRLNDRSAI